MEKSLFLKKIEDYIHNHNLLPSKGKVLVTLSGGADSVALLISLHSLGYNCVAAHCNFHLRGDDSNSDQAFVEELTTKLGIPLKLIHFNVQSIMDSHHMSMEMACRYLRYNWFECLRKDECCDAIAVGHHSNDNVETFFLNAIRGSGINGLAAIKPVNGYIVRPLLCVSRRDVEDFLASIGQNYVTDKSNLSNDFNRNKLRNIIIPSINKLFPQQCLLRTISNISSCNDFYQGAIERAKNECFDKETGIINMPVLNSYPGCTTLLYEIVREYEFNSIQCKEMITSYASGMSGKSFESTDYIALVNREQIIISKREVSEEDSYSISLLHQSPSCPIQFEVTEITKNEPITFTRNPDIAYFDRSILNTSLTLRKWQQGDSFIPFGMKGSKKLSDLFSDSKLSIFDKKKVWLLLANDVIVWVIGIRASNHFRCSQGKESIILKVKNPK